MTLPSNLVRARWPLLGIHKNLRQLFPQNRDLAYRWMSTRNKAFGNLTPVDVVKKWEGAGLLMVRRYFDRVQGETKRAQTKNPQNP